jgi:hypothetical protein
MFSLTSFEVRTRGPLEKRRGGRGGGGSPLPLDTIAIVGGCFGFLILYVPLLKPVLKEGWISADPDEARFIS